MSKAFNFGGGVKSISTAQILKAFTLGAGSTRKAADILEIERHNLLQMVKHRELREQVNKIRLDMLEVAEDNAYEMLLNGDEKMTTFVLRCFGGDKWIPNDKKIMAEAIEQAQAIGKRLDENGNAVEED